MPTNLWRNLPSVSELLDSPPLKRLVDKASQHAVMTKIRSALDDLRSEVQTAKGDFKLPNITELAERIARRILEGDRPALRPVINATGALLPDSLGRAPLAEEAIAEMAAMAADYASLELDLATGEPSPRLAAVEDLLTSLTEAERALVVNNHAAATVLTLAALAAGREVLVSRGQLLDLGDGYRLPELIAASGARLVEVGTTNRTEPADFAVAINPQTAALVLVHTSSNVPMGSISQVTLEQLVKLGRQHQVPVVHILDSAALIDFTALGIAGQPMASDSVRQGADLVLFCGDKLVGGPACGLIVGKREAVERAARHPLARALRLDKLRLAALAATLRLYRQPNVARRAVPLLELLATPVENLKLRAERLAPQMAQCRTLKSVQALEHGASLTEGSMPERQLATWTVALEPADVSAERLAARLRLGPTAVVARVEKERVELDLRSVFPRQDQALLAAVLALDDHPG
jgi:L-seryl-tRNA(Ser) seleniumtransferase